MINKADLPRAIQCAELVGQFLMERNGVWPDEPRTQPILVHHFRPQPNEEEKDKQILTVWHLGSFKNFDILCYKSNKWMGIAPVHIAVVIDDVLCTVCTDRSKQAFKAVSFSNAQESGATEFIEAIKVAVLERSLLETT